MTRSIWSDSTFRLTVKTVKTQFVVALAVGLGLSGTGPVGAAPSPGSSSVGICHRTNAPSKPFVFMAVAASAASIHLAHGDTLADDPADCKQLLLYVTDSLRVGSTASEASSYAVDLNGDGRLDNRLGALFATISNVLGFDAEIATSLEMGDAVILHALRTDSLAKDRAASWQVYLGEPQANPILSGGGTFTIDPSAPTSERLPGRMSDGQCAGGPGTVVLRLGLVSGRPPVEIRLASGLVQADCDAESCSGKLAGGVKKTDVDNIVIPEMAARMQAIVDADPTCAPPSQDPCTGTAGLILALFDANGDHVVSADELKDNGLIAAILAPDVDLLGADGHPGQDGVMDSVSLGLGFTAKHAIFDVP